MTILLTRHDKIGDFVTALPMAKVLKEQTEHRIVFLVSKVNVPMAKNLDFIDDVIEYTKDTKDLIKRIKSVKADVSISGYIDTHLGYCLFRSRIKKRIAPATKLAQIFFNKRVRQRRSEVKMTEWQYNLELLKFFDDSLVLDFHRPLVQFNEKKQNRVVFHPGFGGSSDGNITLDDYLTLAKKASDISEVVFTFGPDDEESKNYIFSNLDFDAVIKDDFQDIWELTKFIASSNLFVSTSTGPMHLAGLTNTNTLSFFGSSLFASSQRWATISEKQFQNNFEIPSNKTEEFFQTIESKMIEVLQN
jgi:ADP-heptose:LPS heptosyltransferase